eukprot:5655380-Ditylum_brightwellii.AAC.1
MSSSTTNNDAPAQGTQTSAFSWDGDGDASEDPEQEVMEVEVNKEAGWKRIGSDCHKSMVKRGKTNGKVELNTEKESPEEENPSAADMVKACGKTALDQESVYKTDMTVEWKIKNGTARSQGILSVRNNKSILQESRQNPHRQHLLQSLFHKARLQER